MKNKVFLLPNEKGIDHPSGEIGGFPMIIGLVRRLGEIKLKESENILIETYLKKQSTYKQSHLFAVEVDLDSGEFRIVTEEYDPNKEILYLRGIQQGNSENLSPVLNLKPAELPKEREKVLNLDKFPSKRNLFELQGLDPEQFPIYSKLMEWYGQRKGEVFEALVRKLESKYFDEDSGKVDRKTPTLLVFKIRKNGAVLYPGEIPEIRDAYLRLATPPPPKKSLEGLCMACGRTRPLTPTAKLKTSIFEFFSLDLNNYVLGMDLKRSNQLTVCLECQEILALGLSVLENELRFRAYTRKINTKNTLFVEHSLLPTAYGTELIAQVVKSLSLIRRNASEERRVSLRKEIDQIRQRMTRVDRRAKKELEKQIKEYQKQLEKIDEFEEIDERTVLEEFVRKGVSYIDLYYIYEMFGVGKFKKVFMDLTFVNADFLKKLIEVISRLERDFAAKGLLVWKGEPYRFEFADLYSLFSIKIADLVRKAMLTGVHVPASELSRDALRNLRDPFLKLNANIDKTIWINRKEYHRRLNTFLFIYQLLDEMDLLKE